MSKKPSKSLAQELDRYITPFRYDGSGKFHLKDYKTNEKGDLDKEKAQEILDANKKRLVEFQEKLYAQDRWSLLIVFQAMPDDVAPVDISMLETPQPALAMPAGAAVVAPPRSGFSINWWLVATIVYAGVAGLLLLRLAIGLCLTWRLARAAQPVSGAAMKAEMH